MRPRTHATGCQRRTAREGASMKILVIDDDLEVLAGLTTALQFHWHDVTVLTAHGRRSRSSPVLRARSGCGAARHGPPGSAWTGRPASDSPRLGRPVLILAPHASDTDQIRALERGADDYIVKPCGFLVLIARIKALLRRAELLPPDRALPDLELGRPRLQLPGSAGERGRRAGEAHARGVQAALSPRPEQPGG